MAETPTTPPTLAYAGDTITWYQPAGDYPAADGWSGAATLQSQGESIDATVTADADRWLITFAATATDALPAGTAHWRLRVTSGAQAFTIAAGTIDLRAAADQITDTRSHEERTLAAIEALLEGRAVDGIESYQIAGRQLVRASVDQLLRWRAQYRRVVQQQRRGGGFATVEVTPRVA